MKNKKIISKEINVYYDGTISNFWFKNNCLHRDNDLPAYIDFVGVQLYYKDGAQYRKKNFY